MEGAAGQEVYDQLKDRLRRGVYPAGARLPGERALARELGVSRMTLRQGLDRLRIEGKILGAAKRGWFAPRPRLGEPPSTLQSFSEMARARGSVPGARVLSLCQRRVQPNESAALHCGDDSSVVELVRLRSLDEVPVCLDTAVVDAGLVPGMAEDVLHDCSLFEYLLDRHGICIERSSYTVHAARVPAEARSHLGLDRDGVVLAADEVTYDNAGRAVMVSSLVYRADAYAFRSDLYRSTT